MKLNLKISAILFGLVCITNTSLAAKFDQPRFCAGLKNLASNNVLVLSKEGTTTGVAAVYKELGMGTKKPMYGVLTGAIKNPNQDLKYGINKWLKETCQGLTFTK